MGTVLDGGVSVPRSRAAGIPILLRLGLCLGSVGVWGCGPGSGPEQGDRTPGEGSGAVEAAHPDRPGALVDDAGRTVDPTAPPDRIVSLVPSATEILIALGRTDRIVGRTDFDTAGVLAPVPSVGGGLQPSIERIASLEPDLVIRFHAESDPDTPRRLDAAGIPHLAIRPDGIDDIRRILTLLATAVDRPQVGDSIRHELDRGLEAAAARVAGAPRPDIVFVLGGDPPLVAGGGTFLHELVELAGGRNLFADTESLYAPISVEEILSRNPERVLAHEGAQIPSALRSLPVHFIPSQIPGLGVVDAAHLLVGILHPDR